MGACPSSAQYKEAAINDLTAALTETCDTMRRTVGTPQEALVRIARVEEYVCNEILMLVVDGSAHEVANRVRQCTHVLHHSIGFVRGAPTHTCIGHPVCAV